MTTTRAQAPHVLSADTFRELLGRFASGVTIVTTRDAAGRSHGMTVSAFSSLSLRPPLVLACIDRAATMHDVLTIGHPFAVNILAADQLALSLRFSELDMDLRFDGVACRDLASGVPAIDGAHAVLECRVLARHAGGDHGIFVGEVVGGHAGVGAPLLYHRGSYPTTPA